MIQKYSWKQRNCIDMNENNGQCSLFCARFCNELRFHAESAEFWTARMARHTLFGQRFTYQNSNMLKI